MWKKDADYCHLSQHARVSHSTSSRPPVSLRRCRSCLSPTDWAFPHSSRMQQTHCRQLHHQGQRKTGPNVCLTYHPALIGTRFRALLLGGCYHAVGASEVTRRRSSSPARPVLHPMRLPTRSRAFFQLRAPPTADCHPKCQPVG